MQHLDPQAAHDFLHNDPQAVLVDCRTEIEHMYVGHPVGAEHVAWQEAPDWEINPHFAAEIWRQVDRDPQRPVVLICRSGRRSVEAGEHLESEGFQNVINVRYGFEGDRDEHMHRNVINGWRVDGLPWEQS